MEFGDGDGLGERLGAAYLSVGGECVGAGDVAVVGAGGVVDGVGRVGADRGGVGVVAGGGAACVGSEWRAGGDESLACD